MTQQQFRSTAALVVRVYPSGTPGRVLIAVEQQGPVYLTGPEIARTLRSAAKTFADDDDGEPAGRHRFLPDAAGTCLADVDGRACGQPPDAPIHDDGPGPPAADNPPYPADRPHEPQREPLPHRYWPGSTSWCLHVFGNRLCGLPWDDPIHGLEGWGLEHGRPR